MADTPNTTDLHVGSRIRMRRKLMGLSQAQLAAAIDLTFQQIQKYERGINRVSASMLHAVAQALAVPVSYFFEGLPGEESATNTENDSLVTEFLTMPGAIGLMRAYIALPPAQRSPIVTLVEALKSVSQADAA